MLSIILYGRNDSHGYNYHKRIAISINCIAETLSNPQDEILFVDYNTPNNLPTILEAIQDTLTLKAKSHLRIFRVRPKQHASFQASLPLLEPIARNVALKRMHPSNKWVLLTNIDMIFLPKDPTKSLSDLVSSLDEGFYTLPRLELPENLWELALDRLSPQKNLSFLREHTEKLHLNTVIRRNGFLKYDNPGDFQLILRDDFLKINGLDERMLKGWHVDSNLSKRMSLLRKESSSIEHLLSAYHCNHTQKETFLHSNRRTENSWTRFITNCTSPHLPLQKNWGLGNEEIEEIKLTPLKLERHLQRSIAALKIEQQKPYDLLIDLEHYNKLFYSPSRVFTYLTDHLCHLPDQTKIAYIGYNQTMRSLLNSYLESRSISLSEETTECSLFIFDFGFETGTPITYTKGRNKLKKIMQKFLKIVPELSPTTKCIGIHSRNSDFNLIFSRHLTIHLNSHVTGLSYGYPAQKWSFNFQRKQLLMLFGYYVTRYFFYQSDRIRKWFFAK